MATKKVKKRKKEQNRQTDHEIWMLRLKVGTVYLLVWLIVTAVVMNHLPDPISAEKFYADSKAHWFIHLGLGIMFIVILKALGRNEEEEEDHESAV